MAAIDRHLRQAGKGNFGDYRYLKDELFELKLATGPGIRIYFSLISNGEIIIALLIGDKKTQARDIEKAKKYLRKII